MVLAESGHQLNALLEPVARRTTPRLMQVFCNTCRNVNMCGASRAEAPKALFLLSYSGLSLVR